jgi:hypothetical protein
MQSTAHHRTFQPVSWPSDSRFLNCLFSILLSFATINCLWRKSRSISPGEMAEWLKAQHWKCCLGVTLTRVRIPVSPFNSSFVTTVEENLFKFHQAAFSSEIERTWKASIQSINESVQNFVSIRLIASYFSRSLAVSWVERLIGQVCYGRSLPAR